jgi:hypothetical protein
MCPNTPPSTYTFRVRFDQCTGIYLDSLKKLANNKTFSIAFKPTFITDTEIAIRYTFRAIQEGADSTRLRLSFHSPMTGNVEHVFFTLYAIGEASGAVLTVTTSQFDFKLTNIDSTRHQSFTITNDGCDTMTVSSIVSSAPITFSVDKRTFPYKLLPAKSIPSGVTFTPHAEGEYLESLIITTDIGIRYITMRGTAYAKHDTLSVVAPSQQISAVLYPNPAHDFVYIPTTGVTLHSLRIVDVLGRSYMIKSLLTSICFHSDR